MINRLLVIVNVMLMTLCVGCGVMESSWYPVEGGYINLRQVTHITTRFSMALKSVENSDGDKVKREEVVAENELITLESIEKAKKRIREVTDEDCAEQSSEDSPRLEFNRISYQAEIVFNYVGGGTHTVKLQKLEDWRTNSDLLALLDGWLSSVNELKVTLGRIVDVGR